MCQELMCQKKNFKDFWFVFVSQVNDDVLVLLMDVLFFLKEFKSILEDNVLVLFLFVCLFFELEKINQENDFQNEVKFQKLDD